MGTSAIHPRISRFDVEIELGPLTNNSTSRKEAIIHHCAANMPIFLPHKPDRSRSG